MKKVVNALLSEFAETKDFTLFLDELIEDLAMSKAHNRKKRTDNLFVIFNIKKKIKSEDLQILEKKTQQVSSD